MLNCLLKLPQTFIAEPCNSRAGGSDFVGNFSLFLDGSCVPYGVIVRARLIFENSQVDCTLRVFETALVEAKSLR